VYFATGDTMDFSLNDHQKLIRDTVRQFMEKEVRPSVRQRDREGRFPTAEIAKLAELGCCGMLTPEEWGGPGLDTVSRGRWKYTNLGSSPD
jgi:alkylation response protein AidB-like acyl-CoA dehydrogenase